MTSELPSFLTASVIIPAARADDWLTTQIRAVQAQVEVGSFEIIVVVNARDGAQADAVRSSVVDQAGRSVRVVHAAERFSAAHARNQGAAVAQSPVLAFCDADDIVRPDWLHHLLAAMRTADAVGGRLIEFTDAGPLPKWRPPVTPGDLPRFLDVPYLVSANMAIDHQAFAEIGGFDESLTRCEDIALSWQAIRRDRRLAYAESAIVDYRVRGSVSNMLRQHYFYGIGMSEVLARDGRPGDTTGAGMLKPNNQAGGLGSPVAVLRKVAIGSGRVVGMVKERRRK